MQCRYHLSGAQAGYMIKNEFYDIEDYQNLWDFLNQAFTYSVYCNYQRNFRYKRGRIPIEIMKEYGSPKINPDLLGIFPLLICDYHLNVITKVGYHVLKSNKKLYTKSMYQTVSISDNSGVMGHFSLILIVVIV